MGAIHLYFTITMTTTLILLVYHFHFPAFFTSFVASIQTINYHRITLNKLIKECFQLHFKLSSKENP